MGEADHRPVYRSGHVMSTVENMGQDSGIEMPEGRFSRAVRKPLKRRHEQAFGVMNRSCCVKSYRRAFQAEFRASAKAPRQKRLGLLKEWLERSK